MSKTVKSALVAHIQLDRDGDFYYEVVDPTGATYLLRIDLPYVPAGTKAWMPAEAFVDGDMDEDEDDWLEEACSSRLPEDEINKPGHYQIRHTEVFDFIDEAVDCIPDGENAMRAAVALGNVIKYVLRAPYKGSFLKDLRKAHIYLGRFCDLMEGE